MYVVRYETKKAIFCISLKALYFLLITNMGKLSDALYSKLLNQSEPLALLGSLFIADRKFAMHHDSSLESGFAFLTSRTFNFLLKDPKQSVIFVLYHCFPSFFLLLDGMRF